MIIYAVYASDYESSWVKKAFVSKEKAEAYAQQIRQGNEALANVYKEYHRRADEIWELVYDRNGFNGEPLFEELDAWCEAERKSLNIHVDCEDDVVIFVQELEVEESMEDEIAPEIEELQRRIYDALLPHIGKPLTLDASIVIKEVLSQAVQDGLLESYPHEGEIKCLIL